MNTAQAANYQCIPATDAVTLIRSEPIIAIFDVRDLNDYRQGHIAQAAHLAESRLMAWFGRLDKSQPVLIYCNLGNASKTYAQMFADFRFSRVYSVDGGYKPLAEALAKSGQ